MGKTKFIVTISRPELTPEEHARRMKEIKKAAEELMLAVYELEARKERERKLAEKAVKADEPDGRELLRQG